MASRPSPHRSASARRPGTPRRPWSQTKAVPDHQIQRPEPLLPPSPALPHPVSQLFSNSPLPSRKVLQSMRRTECLVDPRQFGLPFGLQAKGGKFLFDPRPERFLTPLPQSAIRLESKADVLPATA